MITPDHFFLAVTRGIHELLATLDELVHEDRVFSLLWWKLFNPLSRYSPSGTHQNRVSRSPFSTVAVGELEPHQRSTGPTSFYECIMRHPLAKKRWETCLPTVKAKAKMQVAALIEKFRRIGAACVASSQDFERRKARFEQKQVETQETRTVERLNG